MLFIIIKERMSKMKRLCSYVKTTSAFTLVVMLLLSMMSGVFVLSASADGEVFPVVTNEPTMRYRDNYSPKNSQYKYGYGEFQGTFQTISILLNDEESDFNLESDIQSVSFKYNDPELGEYINTVYRYSYVNDFNKNVWLLL